MGVGGYIGKTRDFRNLALFSLLLPDFPAKGISLESEAKWVNFATGSTRRVSRSPSAGARPSFSAASGLTGSLPPSISASGTTSFESGGSPSSFKFAIGAIPFDDRYKLAAAGEYRMEIHEKGKSRFLVDVGFSSPVLVGDGFLAQFRPDRLVYAVRGEYEREVGRALYASWYAAYSLNMPVDKALPFGGALGTGLALKNQPDFEKLDRILPIRGLRRLEFQTRPGAAIRAGFNTVPARGEGRNRSGLSSEWAPAGRDRRPALRRSGPNGCLQAFHRAEETARR